jgi:hypothetical protein
VVKGEKERKKKKCEGFSALYHSTGRCSRSEQAKGSDLCMLQALGRLQQITKELLHERDRVNPKRMVEAQLGQASLQVLELAISERLHRRWPTGKNGRKANLTKKKQQKKTTKITTSSRTIF